MKNTLRIFLLIVILAQVSLDVSGQNRWWQREIPAPSANQMINPNYLSKKRELEQTLDRMNSLAKERNNYANAGQTDAVKNANEMLQFMGKKMNTLEYELSKISMYLSNPSYYQNNNTQITNQQQTDVYISQPTISDSPAKPTNSYLLTVYKIKNCNKDEFKSNYDYNAESLSLFNELKSNISQIVKLETDYSSYSIDFLKKEIEYYQIFIDNWGNGNTIGTNEAKKEIENLNADISRKEEEFIRNKLSEITDIVVHIEIIGSFTEMVHPKNLKGWHTCYGYNLRINGTLLNEIGGFHNSGLYDTYDPFRVYYYKNGNERKYSYSLKDGYNIIDNYFDSKSMYIGYNYETYFNGKDGYKIAHDSFDLNVPITAAKTTNVYLYFHISGAGNVQVKYQIN